MGPEHCWMGVTGAPFSAGQWGVLRGVGWAQEEEYGGAGVGCDAGGGCAARGGVCGRPGSGAVVGRWLRGGGRCGSGWGGQEWGCWGETGAGGDAVGGLLGVGCLGGIQVEDSAGG